MYLLCVGVLLIWTNISEFQFDQGRGSAWKPAKGDVVSSLDIVIYLFICLFIASAGFWPRGQNLRRHPRSPRVYTYKDKEYLLKK